MPYEITVSPAVEPVSLAEAKLHLRVTNNVEDSLITALITASRQGIEHHCGPLITSTVREWFSGFTGCLELWAPTAQSISSITYLQAGETVPETVSASLYRLVRRPPGGHPLVTLRANQYWPTDSLETGLPVIVEYLAGFGDAAADVPAPLKHALLIDLAARYENREEFLRGNNTIPSTLPATSGFWQLLREYRT